MWHSLIHKCIHWPIIIIKLLIIYIIITQTNTNTSPLQGCGAFHCFTPHLLSFISLCCISSQIHSRTHVSIQSYNLYNMTMVVFTACHREHLLLGRFPWQRSSTQCRAPPAERCLIRSESCLPLQLQSYRGCMGFSVRRCIDWHAEVEEEESEERWCCVRVCVRGLVRDSVIDLKWGQVSWDSPGRVGGT